MRRRAWKNLVLLLTIPIIMLSLIADVTPLYGGPKIPRVKKKKGESQKSDHTFVGKVKSIDIKNRILVLTTTEGDQEETFNYKKGVRITSVHKTGELKISELAVGMLVTLYIKSSKSTSEVYEILLM
ncbi:MAG: hypothetical protein LAO21_04620 [Acidobacteriia bacterium]|nr:hypothetical protein [Terriglobia bacterium]